MTQLAGQLEGAGDGRMIERKLRRAWHKERRYIHLRGLCHLLLWLVALVAVDFLVDWLFHMPGWWRVTLLAANIIILLWVLLGHWLLRLRRYDPVRVALQVERRHPELRSLLVSYVQLRGELPPGSQASPQLIEAMRKQAFERTAPLDFREIVSYGELRRILLVSLCVVAFSGAISLRWEEYVRVLVARMFNPSLDIRYPTRTRVEPLRDIVVRQGDPVTIEAYVRGMAPSEGTLFVKPDDGEWERLPLTLAHHREPGPAGLKVYSYTLNSVIRSFDYYVKVGDSRPDRRRDKRRVTVVPPPVVESARATLTFPQYMNRQPRTLETLNIEVPEGTSIRWEFALSSQVASGRMLLGDRDEPPRVVNLEISPDGRLAWADVTVDKSTSYRFEWKERQHGFDFPDDSRHYIQVIPDAPPEAEIIWPPSDEKATVQKTLTIDFRATDDYGISKARIIYQFNDGPEKTRELPGYTGGTARHVWKLRPDLPEFKDGDLLVMTYCIEVEDNYPGPGGPHRSRSGTRTLQIVSIAEYRQYMLERIARLIEEIKGVRDSEQKSKEEVETLKKEYESLFGPMTQPAQP